MSNLTTILENESGIQYQGVKDASSRTGSYPVVGLIVGQFKRGRYDKPMTITNENIRAQLGYDPSNPYYVAVQDALNTGVPSIQVLRIKSGGNGRELSISCSNALNYAYFYGSDLILNYSRIEVDGKPYEPSFLNDERGEIDIYVSSMSGLFGMHNESSVKDYRVKILLDSDIKFLSALNDQEEGVRIAFVEDFGEGLSTNESIVYSSEEHAIYFCLTKNSLMPM